MVGDMRTGSDVELQIDERVRPQSFDEFIGQRRVVDRLKTYVAAALERGEALDHVLLYGPPGLGKTTLACILSKEMGSEIITTSGAAIEKKGDLAAILTHLKVRDILFIDEIHRLNRQIEEVLYPALEDFKLDLVIGQGIGAKTVRIKLAQFTLVGATTRFGLLSKPLRNRFGITERLDYYPPQELTQIVFRSAGILGIEIAEDAALEVARRARGTPRNVNMLLKRIRDIAQVEGAKRIGLDVVKNALEKLEIDEMGLNALDRKYLRVVIEKFNGGPVGIETVCTALQEDKDTVESVVEPYLMQIGFVKRTPKGRIATPLSYKHLGLSGKGGYEGTLF
ncbi:MAG TPA: Holliday junction branch migration DNA helicase RuvB [Proteobacteria bacterium]|nr:Holliday junction branch migration DNA helicase RuvB [Pseudomonadota bacterium]